MNKQASEVSTRPEPSIIRHLLLRLWLGLAVILPASPLLAEEPDQVSRANSVGLPQDGVAWMSGGIGDEALQEMRKSAASYNVHVLFTDRQGSYLANIPFTVAGRDGRQIHAGVSDGPLLYLRLPTGSYRVSAEIDRVWQSRSIRVVSNGRPAKLSFVARGE